MVTVHTKTLIGMLSGIPILVMVLTLSLFYLHHFHDVCYSALNQ